MKTVAFENRQFGIENPEGSQLKKETFITKGVYPEIATLNLEMVKKKLQDPIEGEGWSPEQCESAELEYKRYLSLCKKYGKGIVPNKLMDKFWHYHILDTFAYHEDCNRILGHYMHHFPYFGMRGEEDAKRLEESFKETQLLYEGTFGEPMDRDDLSKCWHNCVSRCWHACKSQLWGTSADGIYMEDTINLICPQPITSERIAYLESKGIASEIASLDFEMIKKKLQDKEEGAGWSSEQCDIAEMEYKRYLHLCKKYETELVVPNLVMNTFWRYHILDTIAYHRDTLKVFGYYLHHYPYFGMGGESEGQFARDRFAYTQKLYEEEFGESMTREEVVGVFSPSAIRGAMACRKAS